MKVFVLCPAATKSGGPEALHQFAGALRNKGVEAAVVYYPGGRHAEQVPDAYRHYGVAVSKQVEDTPDAIVVIPEVVTSLAWQFTNARKAIWWLSIDNYFKWQKNNPGPSVLETRPDIVHLCQSHYARDFLSSRGVGPLLMLTDFLTAGTFLEGPAAERLPVVVYNPKKSPETTQRLMARAGGPVWIPLQNLSLSDMADLLREVRIYVDFGPHPGRDRIPREAASCGAVVITGRKGAAAFSADIPLPDRFRVDEQRSDFDAAVNALIDELLASDAAFQEAFEQQEPYRSWIRRNEQVFMAEVNGFIDAMSVLPAAVVA